MTAKKKWTAKTVKRLGDGWHRDSGDDKVRGLYLQVSNGGKARSWVLRYSINGQAHYMGLGSPANGVGLKQARAKATQNRQLLDQKKDPLTERQKQQTAARLEQSRTMTFDQAAAQYIAAHEAGWKNAMHRLQWRSSIRDYVSPVIGSLPVASIDTPEVMKVLQPIWTTMNETASRVRGRVESVLDWARVQNLRQGENPARWKGHLDKLLAKPSKVKAVEHHEALPYVELPAFMAKLRSEDSVVARAIEFTVLTACRRNEVLDAQWSEIDLATGTWIIPKERMKAEKEHRIPLSSHALDILRALPKDAQPFAGCGIHHPGRLLRKWKIGGTLHGFRSTFRDWAAERTSFPREACEAALAHSNGSATERAYSRSDLLDQRRRLMEAWADYCESPPVAVATVTPIRARP